jgi:cardiolipin synthase C
MIFFRIFLLTFFLYSCGHWGPSRLTNKRQFASEENSLRPQEVTLLIDRNLAAKARENLILNESRELFISTYLFEMDEFGKNELGLIYDAVKRGVKVTLVVDGVGKDNGAEEIGFVRAKATLKALEEAGVKVKIYNPKFRRILSINQRNHKKIIIGSDSFIVGDRNYAKGYFNRGNTKNYLSAEVLIKGEERERAFNAFQNLLSDEEKVLTPFTPFLAQSTVEEARKEIEIWEKLAFEQRASTQTSRTGKIFSAIEAEYLDDQLQGSESTPKILKLIGQAKESLTIMNPYIVLTDELNQALTDAIRRGVQITIITNSEESNNVPIITSAWKEDRKRLAELGVSIYEVQKGNFLHAKIILQDDERSYIGSYNLDPRSQNINLENGAIMHDQKFTSYLKKYSDRIRKTLTKPLDKSSLSAPNRCIRFLNTLLRPHL